MKYTTYEYNGCLFTICFKQAPWITSRATPASNNDSSGCKSKITKTSPEV